MPELALVALLILAYTLVAVRLDRLSISGPILLVTAGALIGPAGIGAVDAPATSEPFRVLAELTLALLLFTDASTIGLREAGRIAWLPGRLLAVGLPLTIALGALVGWLMIPALGVGFALLVGSILAPTDAALSLPILLDRAIPVRVRRAINIESGLNDGIATPFVTLSLAIAAAEETSGDPALARRRPGIEIAVAVAVAIAVGGVGGRLLVERTRDGVGPRRGPNRLPSSPWRSSPTPARRPSAGTDSWRPSGPGSPSGRRRRVQSRPSSSPKRSGWVRRTSSGCSSASPWSGPSWRRDSTRSSSPTPP